MRFSGKVGYVIAEETATDVWTETATERPYYGDVLTNNRRWDTGEGVNDNIKITNRISVVADDYAYEHLGEIRYVYYLGKRWKVTSIDITRPRIVLSLGDLYNGG